MQKKNTHDTCLDIVACDRVAYAVGKLKELELFVSIVPRLPALNMIAIKKQNNSIPFSVVYI
jgi:hypothetical protein